MYPISENQADMAQLVEQRIRNAWVTSSSLVIGSINKKMITFRVIIFLYLNAVIAQLVEQRLPKPQVTSSSLAYRSFLAVRNSHSCPRSELFGTPHQVSQVEPCLPLKFYFSPIISHPRCPNTKKRYPKAFRRVTPEKFHSSFYCCKITLYF